MRSQQSIHFAADRQGRLSPAGLSTSLPVSAREPTPAAGGAAVGLGLVRGRVRAGVCSAAIDSAAAAVSPTAAAMGRNPGRAIVISHAGARGEPPPDLRCSRRDVARQLVATPVLGALCRAARSGSASEPRARTTPAARDGQDESDRLAASGCARGPRSTARTSLRLVAETTRSRGALLMPAHPNLCLQSCASLACDGTSDPAPYVASGRRLDGGARVGACKIQEAREAR